MSRDEPDTDDRDECDPIIVAADDGEVLDATEDGAVACVADGDGMAVRIDPESELGERLAWHAGHRGESPDALLDEAIREFLDARRRDGGREPTVRCPNGHTFDRGEGAAASFDGDEARWQCPECGAWTDGPPPG